jgi:hypothetical protein
MRLLSRVELALAGKDFLSLTNLLLEVLVMRDFVLNFHSGWRYLVLLMLIVMFVFYAYEYFTKRKLPYEKHIDMGYMGVIHVQVILGILLLIVDIFTGWFEGRLLGHAIVMILQEPLATFYKKYATKIEPIDPQRRRLLGMGIPIASLLLIFIGLAAISRPLLGS